MNSFDSISGKALQMLALGREIENLISRGPVSDNAFKATKKLTDYNGSKPNESGSNVQCITFLRRILSQKEHICTANAFLITAPHTHWHKNALITILKDHDHYSIGPHKISELSTYYPVSFCFTPNGMKAYEWADSSLFPETRSVFLAYKVLQEIEGMIPPDLPVGLALNYKFKDLLSEAIISITEHTPYDELLGNLPTALIERSEDFYLRHPIAEVEQVAWAAFESPLHASSSCSEVVNFFDQASKEDKKRIVALVNARLNLIATAGKIAPTEKNK